MPARTRVRVPADGSSACRAGSEAFSAAVATASTQMMIGRHSRASYIILASISLLGTCARRTLLTRMPMNGVACATVVVGRVLACEEAHEAQRRAQGKNMCRARRELASTQACACALAECACALLVAENGQRDACRKASTVSVCECQMSARETCIELSVTSERITVRNLS